VLLPDGSIWYPGSKRKLPAPTFLRVTVWTLAFLVAIAGAGLIVEHYHPSWMDPIRHVVTTPGQTGNSRTHGGGTSTSVPGGSGSNKMRQTSATSSSVTYSLPGAPYQLAIKTTHRCYVVVKSLASGFDLFASTISAGATQSVLVPGGAATVEAFAAGSSLAVSFHGHQVGTISELRYAIAYNFNPTSS